MKNQVFNIAEAKMHLSRLMERVESGECITIARNKRPIAVVSPAYKSAEEVLSQFDSLRARIREQNAGNAVLGPGETWRDFIDSGRRQ